MSDEVSLNAKFVAFGMTYLGLGPAFAKGRDLWRNSFGVKEDSRESVQKRHDIIYTALFNLSLGPMIYYASGSRNLEEITIATLSATTLGSVNGIPLGYATDTFRDLTGLKNCERPSYPNFLKRQSSRIKKLIAAGLIAGSIGLTAGVYAVTNDKDEPVKIQNVSEVTLPEKTR